MTILGALLRGDPNLNNPSTRLSSENFALFADGLPSIAGVPVTEKTLYGRTAWFRGVRIIAGTIAAMPLHTYRRGTRERMPGWVLDEPCPNVAAPFEFWQTMIANAITWGTGYALKSFNSSGVVTRLTPIHPSAVKLHLTRPDEDNPSGKWWEIRQSDGLDTLVATPKELFELPYMSLDGRVGITPMAILRESLGIGIAADRTAAGFYGNGANPGSILTTDQRLEPEDADRLKARWKARFGGPSNVGDIAILDSGATWSAVSVPPEDAQLLESRQFSVTEIARILGIPPHLLADLDKSTSWGTGIESQMTQFVTFTLLPWLRVIEQRATRELLPGGWQGRSYAEYQVEGLLRADSTTRANYYRTAIQVGWMNRAEVRDKENLEPVAGLDDFLVPSNVAVLTDGEYVPLSAAGVNAAEPLVTQPGGTDANAA